MSRPDFHPLQAEEIARAFQEAGVEYLFPGTTQDVEEQTTAAIRCGHRGKAASRRIIRHDH